MPRRQFSGLEVSKILVNEWGFEPVHGNGSHLVFRLERDDIAEPRVVTVPRHDPIREGTLRNIMKQAGGKNFDRFCRELDKNL